MTLGCQSKKLSNLVGKKTTTVVSMGLYARKSSKRKTGFTSWFDQFVTVSLSY